MCARVGYHTWLVHLGTTIYINTSNAVILNPSFSLALSRFLLTLPRSFRYNLYQNVMFRASLKYLNALEDKHSRCPKESNILMTTSTFKVKKARYIGSRKMVSVLQDEKFENC